MLQPIRFEPLFLGTTKSIPQRKKSNSKPERAGFLEQRHQSAANVGRHDAIHRPDEFAADENHRHGGGGAEEVRERGLDAPGHGMVVELVDGGADAHPAEEALDGVAHAARAHAEYHHRAARRQPHHPLQSFRGGGGIARI